jgi:hypothetical protein
MHLLSCINPTHPVKEMIVITIPKAMIKPVTPATWIFPKNK